MSATLDALSWLCMVSGGAFLIIGGVGLLRFPDFFTRQHAAGVIDTLGCLLIALGLILQAGFSLVTMKLMIIVFFILFTSPTATHALAKSALHGKHKPLLHRQDD